MIEYRISCADLYRHHFAVDCIVRDAHGAIDLTLPSWIPGSYLMREFARHVVAVEAVVEGVPVTVEKTNKNTWRCVGKGGTLRFKATVYALDRSVRGAYLDVMRGYFNGACVFPMVRGRELEPTELSIERPSDGLCAGWRVATAMAPTAVDDLGFGRYSAENYDELIDHPVEISDHQGADFVAGGQPHRIVVAGYCDSDLERVAADLTQLCESQIAFFDGDVPFDRYTFLGLAVDQGYGGLEHRASSSLIFNRADLPRAGEPDVTASYQRFLALASHEYFHTWHVKRSKPEAFVPYRLSERNYTRQLWVFEGVTSYYQEIFLLRGQLIGVPAFLRRLGELLTRVYRMPGRKVQSIAEASFDAWDVFYKPDANSPNATTSYYSKGAVVALALDLELRDRSDSVITLDVLVRELWRRYGKVGRGVPESGFEDLARELAGDAFGEFFDGAVRGMADLPIASLFEKFGLQLGFRAAAGLEDKGGMPARVEERRVWLGVAWRAAPVGIEVTTVYEAGPAQLGGVNPGDLLIAINRLQVSAQNLDARLTRFEEREKVLVSVLRDGELLGFTLTLEPPPEDCCYLTVDAAASERAVRLRQAWLGI